jgi:hypothetical protein
MSDVSQVERVINVADQIQKRVTVALAGIEREMTIMKWSAEFRVIMWEAVASTALERADKARDD